MWKIISRPRKVWNKIPEKERKHRREMMLCAIRELPVRHTHSIRPDEPLAYCAKCREWTPMRWLPIAERGKKAEQWFECEFCSGRDLTLRYLPMKQETVSRSARQKNNLKGVGV